MTVSRRDLLAGSLAAAAVGCAPARPREGDIVAAGQPAAILILALAPARLLGWPRRPAAAALALLPRSADRPELGALSSGGAPADLETIAALRPEVILDYGDVDPDFRAIAERVRRRVGRPYRMIDGALRRTPDALVEAGALLGASARAGRLAAEATRILSRWSASAKAGPSFYYARGGDGLETGFAGSLATEALEGGGWRNVATGGRDIARPSIARPSIARPSIARISREQFAQWDPEAVVTLDPRFARSAAADPVWRDRRGGGRRRLLLLPDVPFGWIDRPPSINRLLGCAWLGEFDSPPSRAAEIASDFASLFYDRRPSRDQARALVPRWLG